MNHRYKSVISGLLILILIISLAFLAQGRIPAYALARNASEDDTPLRIAICLDKDDSYSKYVKEGYKDAITASFSDQQVLFAEQIASSLPSPSTAAETLIQTGPDIIFTYGDASLGAAAELTTEIPIVFGGVMNYRSLLHLMPSSDNFTERNVTGISAIPSMDEQLSLLIEACGYYPKAVGILFDPTDSDAILQDEILEEYLNEAGIPWSEFEISDYSPSSDDTTGSAESPIVSFPSITVAASGKEGANIHPDSISESGDLTGINEPKSARSALSSPLWKYPVPSDSDLLSEEETLSIACSQCDVLYISAKSLLAADTSTLMRIQDMANDNHIVTVGGDEIAGAATTVCLYEDPYDLGYRCGLYAVDILKEEDSIEHMTIGSYNSDYCRKLYQTYPSEILGKTWPKSFHKYNDYLDSYEPGKLAKNQ